MGTEGRPPAACRIHLPPRHQPHRFGGRPPKLRSRRGTAAPREAGHVVTVGEIPSGLPRFSPPMLRIGEVDGILPLAFAALLLSYMESVSAARAFAAKYGYKLDVRQELLGIGSANLLVAFGQGYPVAGGLSQSAVNEKAGAKTPLSLVFASITLAFCLLFFTGFLQDLPKAVLAAIVLMAVKGLINFRE